MKRSLSIANPNINLRSHNILIARIVEKDTGKIISKLYFADLAGWGGWIYINRELCKRTWSD